MDRRVVGAGMHRSGWPRAAQALRRVASGSGTLLDDFADASFSYQAIRRDRREPWVGIFHHPVRVSSPLQRDATCRLRHIGRHPFWEGSRPMLRGAVALCEEVAADLRDWLGVPTVSIWHPTETGVPRWRADAALEYRRLVQAGFCLRNLRLIFQLDAPGWRRVQLAEANRRYRARSERLRERPVRPEVNPCKVEVVRRLGDAAYDRLLAESVLVAEFYGAAASNLIVECMVRGTPILVNRLPGVEEYLGGDYPLYWSDVSGIPPLLEPARLEAASAELLERSRGLPAFAEFASRVRDFVNCSD